MFTLVKCKICESECSCLVIDKVRSLKTLLELLDDHFYSFCGWRFSVDCTRQVLLNSEWWKQRFSTTSDRSYNFMMNGVGATKHRTVKWWTVKSAHIFSSTCIVSTKRVWNTVMDCQRLDCLRHRRRTFMLISAFCARLSAVVKTLYVSCIQVCRSSFSSRSSSLSQFFANCQWR